MSGRWFGFNVGLVFVLPHPFPFLSFPAPVHPLAFTFGFGPILFHLWNSFSLVVLALCLFPFPSPGLTSCGMVLVVWVWAWGYFGLGLGVHVAL